MSVTNRLASSLNRRDEEPNTELAKEIAAAGNTAAVKELIENLHHKNKAVQSDSIKVIYEIGKLNPGLFTGYVKELVALLDTKNNRLQWGVMTAIDHITNDVPKAVYAALSKIISTADQGSVITNDHCVSILVKLSAIENCQEVTLALLNERLLKSPVNQLPMYAEQALPVIDEKNKEGFIKTLIARLGDVEKESKRLRIEKVIKKLGK
jgi:uncharacterized protein YfcZ (UPF0381/DUF406 family)